MAVTIRLMRMGTHKRPFYRVVVADSRAPRDGRALAFLGTYDPLQQPAQATLDQEQALRWLRRGAIPSDTVRQLLRKAGVMQRFRESARSAAP